MERSLSDLESALGHVGWLYHLPRANRVAGRQEWITELCSGKRVVHMGFADVGCEPNRSAPGAWLHARLALAAGEIVGLDSDPETVASAKAHGFDVAMVDCTDVEAVHRLQIHRADVVLVGELIEHVDDPVALLKSASALVRPDGEVVVTTPNARSLHGLLLAAARREMVHPDHLMSFSARQLFETARRSGLRPTELLTYRRDNQSRLERFVWSPSSGYGPLVHWAIEQASRVIGRPFAYLDPGLILRCKI